MKKKYIYEVDAGSPFQVFKAAEDLTETFRAVTLTDNGVRLSKLGEIPCGLLMSKTFRAGADAYILTGGIGFAEIGEPVTAGDLLTVDNDGALIKCIADDFIFARALESSQSGLIHVALIYAGFIDVEFTVEEWDTLKIFFGFPISKHRRYRGISYPAPKADLTKQELLDVGNYAVDNKMILNAAGEVANRVLGAALKRKEVHRLSAVSY